MIPFGFKCYEILSNGKFSSSGEQPPEGDITYTLPVTCELIATEQCTAEYQDSWVLSLALAGDCSAVLRTDCQGTA